MNLLCRVLCSCVCRPFFTYWVTFVQIVCYIVSVVVYGFSPIGISVKTVESEVFKVTAYKSSISFFVNFFVIVSFVVSTNTFDSVERLLCNLL